MDSIKTVPDDSNVERGFSLVEVLIILIKRRTLIVLLPLTAAIAAIAIGLSMPDVYRSSTQLMPPQQVQSGTAAILAQLGGAAAAVTGGAAGKTPNDLYIGMLSSRSVGDNLVTRFGLRAEYGNVSPERAREQLEKNTAVTSSKNGLIRIEVEDTNRTRSAKLANAYVDELKQLMKVLAVTEASQRRVFFERQLEQSKDDLASAEIRLKNALDTRGVISVDSDSRAVIEIVGRLRAQISAKEVQLTAMKAFVTPNNQAYKRGQEELSGLRAELSRLQNGSAAGTRPADNSGGKVGLENIKLLRDVKYYQMLYELLAKQYEVARLDEAKDAAIVQVLDPAVEPERKAKPRVLFMAVVAMLGGLTVAVVLAFVLHAKEVFVSTPAGKDQWDELMSRLRIRSVRRA